MAVSGCSTSQPEPTVRVEFVHPELPAVARRPCARPVTLPDRRISAGEATSYWNRDRSALIECETRRAAGVAAVDQIPNRPAEE